MRARLFLPLGAMFVVALILGAVLLRSFAIGAFDRGKQAGGALGRADCRSAQQPRCASSANPQQTLDAFGQSLGTGGVLQFRPAGAAPPAPSAVQPSSTAGKAPRWFVDILAVPEMGAVFPVNIDGKRVGDIVFDPDMSADIYEKWIGFLAILVSAVALALLTGIIAYVTAGAALGPLRDLGEGLTRMRQGQLWGAHPAGRAAGDTPKRRGSQRSWPKP